MCQSVKHGSHSFLGVSILWFKKLLHEPFVKHGSDDVVHYLKERRNFILRTKQNIDLPNIFRVGSFGMIQVRIKDSRSLWSWYIKRTRQSFPHRGFNSSFDPSWSEWPTTIDPDPGHPSQRNMPLKQQKQQKTTIFIHSIQVQRKVRKKGNYIIENKMTDYILTKNSIWVCVQQPHITTVKTQK